ncbi:hypothetical protein [Xylella taiwanensis]|nr:hypothetical protein [Xylella taiwanensis]
MIVFVLWGSVVRICASLSSPVEVVRHVVFPWSVEGWGGQVQDP